MSVIINDFEVVVEPPTAPSGDGAAETEQQPPSTTLRPVDIDNIRRRQLARRERLRAH
jgi:hypothetical protein